jgi:hypothetical protein
MVFLSRASKGENVLILFPILAENLKQDELLLNFHEFFYNLENSGKTYKISNNNIEEVKDSEIKKKKRSGKYTEFVDSVYFPDLFFFFISESLTSSILLFNILFFSFLFQNP